MTDQTAPANSYVNDYQPPSGDKPVAGPSQPLVAPPDLQPTPNYEPISVPTQSQVMPADPSSSMTDPLPKTMPPFPQSTETSEKLEDQNIFFLLGIKEDEATGEQRESFLDELQQVIWEDFLENDVQLLLTKQEMDELQVLLGKTKGKAIEEQEEIVVFLEKLIPDLEEIMLEKALELKADMVRERIAGMKQRFVEKPENLKQIELAEQQLSDSQWLSMAKTLNSI